MLALIMGEFKSEVNGVVLSVRSWGNTFAVWTRDFKDKRAIEQVTKKMKDIFGQEAEVRYQRHQTVLRKMKTTKKSPQHSDDSTGEVSSEGEYKPKRRFIVSDATRGKLREVFAEPTPFAADIKMPPIVSILPTETQSTVGEPQTAAEESVAPKTGKKGIQEIRTAEDVAAPLDEVRESETMKEATPEIVVRRDEPLTKLGKIGLGVMVLSSIATGALAYLLF